MGETLSEKSLRLALPGRNLARLANYPKIIERPWRFWLAAGSYWAIFNIAGDHWPKTTEEAIRVLQKTTAIKPCLLLNNIEDIAAIARPCIRLKVPIILHVAGRPKLLTPPKEIVRRRSKPLIQFSRVPINLIRQCSTLGDLDSTLRKELSRVASRYDSFSGKISVEEEYAILHRFFLWYAQEKGIGSSSGAAQQILHTLELGGLGGRRDHYFHSFQVFFLGLWAIGSAINIFREPIRRMNWDVSPEFIWFLVSMWHDVGYSVQSSPRIQRGIYGVDLNIPITTEIQSYLSHPDVNHALRIVCSLIEHLLSAKAKVAWIEPTVNCSPTIIEAGLATAFESNVATGHGAASSLRLYTDLIKSVNGCPTQNKRNRLRQSMLLAAASIPFHDFQFRNQARESITRLIIPSRTMPFAVLLAFIDSLQEDRRELDNTNSTEPFLRGLAIERGNTISAIVEHQAMSYEGLLMKMVEAHDIMGCVTCGRGLRIEYPATIYRVSES